MASGAITNDICNNAAFDDVQKAAAGCGQTYMVTDSATTILQTVFGIAGLLAVVFIIIGAIQYITSSGDAAKANKAKNTILYSVIGLVIAMVAFAIVYFVTDHI